MQRIVVGCVALLFVSGCAAGLPWTNPFGPEANEVVPNPMFVASNDPAHVWETVVDVIDDDFRIKLEEPVRAVGGVITEGRLETYWQTAGTAFEPWNRDSASVYERVEATLQTIRRQVTARVSPASGGFWIEVTAFKELEDLPQPTAGSMGASTFHYDSTLTRVVNPVGEQGTNPGWIRQGRDTALEQYLIYHLQTRFGGIGEPRSHASRERQTGSLEPRRDAPIRQVAYQPPLSGAREPLSSRPATRRVAPAPDQLDDPPEMEMIVQTAGTTTVAGESSAFAQSVAAGGTQQDLGPCVEGVEPLSEYRPLRARLEKFVTDVPVDYYHFYGTRSSLTCMTLSLGTAAVLANTMLDQSFRNWYQNDVRSASTDQFASWVKPFGDGAIMIPLFAGTALLGPAVCGELGQDIGTWGERSLRAVAVGAPLVLALQFGLGAGRPNEHPWGSHWNPFSDDNSVSGHAFIGAIPFLTAAKMSDTLPEKIVFCGLSTLTGWSRINDDKHYLSQVMLGWTFAYLSCTAVDVTDDHRPAFLITPMALAAGPGVAMVWTI